jgi:hypothetical protein
VLYHVQPSQLRKFERVSLMQFHGSHWLQ